MTHQNKKSKKPAQASSNAMVEQTLPGDEWQTQRRGTNENEYAIYQAAAESLGWQVKTFDEWLSS